MFKTAVDNQCKYMYLLFKRKKISYKFFKAFCETKALFKIKYVHF